MLITKGGKAVAALIDISLFERLRKLDEEFERMRAELTEAFSGMPEEEVNTLIDEAVAEARKEVRAKCKPW